MGLSTELLSEFAKITNDSSDKKKTETIAYGKTVIYNGQTYVQLDGSELLTPVTTTVTTKDDDRVQVMIKDHTATIMGNVTNPSAGSNEVAEIGRHVDEFKMVIADKVDAEELEAEIARINELKADVARVEKLEGDMADIDTIVAEKIDAQLVDVDELVATKVEAEVANMDILTADDLTSINADIYNLQSTYADFEVANANKFQAIDASISKLDTEKASITQLNAVNASIESLETTYANFEKTTTDELSAITANISGLDAKYASIDLANIKMADIGTLFANAGLITSATIKDGHVTGYLDAVEVNANSITAGTLSVDRLIFRGSENSVIYELNNITGALQAVQGNTLNGEILTNRSITVDKIVANSITANELNISNIFGNSAVLSTLTTQSAFINAISSNSVVVGASNDALNALNAVNSIEIGNRNLIPSSRVIKNGVGAWTVNFSSVTNGQSDPFGKTNATVVKTTNANTYALITKGNVLKQLGKHSFSIWMKADKATTVNIVISANSQNDNKCACAVTTEWKRFTMTVDVTTLDRTYDLVIGGWSSFDTTATVHFAYPMLVYGSKPMDWSPAPEDVDASITAVQNSANATDAVLANWCYNNNTSYINGGKIYVGTVTAEKIASNAITADKIAANAVTVNSIAAGAITAEKLSVDSLSAITASLGTVTAGLITSQSATGYFDIDLDNHKIQSKSFTSMTVSETVDYTFNITSWSWGNVNYSRVYYPEVNISDGILTLSGTTYDAVGILQDSVRKLLVTNSGIYSPKVTTDNMLCKGVAGADNVYATETINGHTIVARDALSSSGSLSVAGDVSIRGKLSITASINGGTVPVSTAVTISTLTDMKNYPSFIGSAYVGSTWYDVISARHRNGADDGTSYGLTVYTQLNATGDLYWNKQYGASSWQSSRTIVDSSNVGTYVCTKGGSSASSGYYYKFADGTMICTKSMTFTVNTTSAWGGVFESTSQMNFGNWPATFSATPIINVSMTGSNDAYLGSVHNTSTTACGTAYAYRPVSTSSASVKVDIIGIGRWK